MQEYTRLFLKPIKDLKKDNTYNLAWRRAILECCVNGEYENKEGQIFISEYDLALKLSKYYWNLIGYFDLKQGANQMMRVYVKEIESFYLSGKNKEKLWFNKIESYLRRYPIYFEKSIHKMISFLEKHMISKFEKVGKEHVELYSINHSSKSIVIAEKNMFSLLENAEYINDIIDFYWAKLVDEYNDSPNIINKVIDSKLKKLPKVNLNSIKKVLIEQYHYEGIEDFFTGEHIHVDEIHMHHVFPYDFAYQNQIWNIVITSKYNICEMKNIKLSDELIEKLNQRNMKLFESIKNSRLRQKNVLKYEHQNHLVNGYYEMFKMKK